MIRQRHFRNFDMTETAQALTSNARAAIAEALNQSLAETTVATMLGIAMEKACWALSESE